MSELAFFSPPESTTRRQIDPFRQTVQSYLPPGANVPPMRAHCRHLANTIECVLPSAHLTPQLKQQIDRMGHFCTAHGKISPGMPEHVLSPNNCPFARGIWAPSNTCFLGPTLVHNRNGISIGSAVFAQLMTECRYTLHGTPLPHQNCPFRWGM